MYMPIWMRQMNVEKMRNQSVGFLAFGQAGFIPETVRESLEDHKFRIVSGA
jgi:hypothetical protein